MPKLLSIREYADHRKAAGLVGGTRQGVERAIAAKRILLIDGKIDPDVADIQWEKNTRRRVDLHSQSPTVETPASESMVQADRSGDPSWAASKARTEAAVAELKELQLARQKGELVDRAGVERAAYQTGRQLQKSLIDVFPARVAVELASLTDPWGVECFLREQLRGELRAVAGTSSTTER
jgi:hypothetical protein